MSDKHVAEFMALSAAIEQAQAAMAEQYREIQAQYERAMNEAVARYQKALTPDGGATATDDDNDTAAAGKPKTYQEGADEIYQDIGTDDD